MSKIEEIRDLERYSVGQGFEIVVIHTEKLTDLLAYVEAAEECFNNDGSRRIFAAAALSTARDRLVQARRALGLE